MDPLEPIGPVNRLFFRFQTLGVGLFLKVAFRLSVQGPALPDNGPLIVAANHESLIDPVVLQIAVKRRLHYLMTSDFYFKPLLKRYVGIMRCIPVMEEQLNREALRAALGVLDAGRPIGIFPQGGLKEAGDFSAAFPGIALLAVKSGAPVVPVRISGTSRAWPRGARFFHPAKIDVRIGPPFSTDRFAEKDPTGQRAKLERISEGIMETIKNL